MKPEPSRIEPIFSERIWGARSLEPLFPGKTNLDPPVGEAWLTGTECSMGSGPLAGKKLGEAWRAMPAGWRGTQFSSGTDFPLLLKFIFPTDKLSIQVHPDDAYALAHEKEAGGKGKTEMWHVVTARPGATLLAGLKPGVGRERFAAAIADGTLESLLEAHEVHAGDTFFVPAGTPHTIGTDMVICEVQEYSDLTYRIYDYARVDSRGVPRELHIRKALEVIRFDQPPGGRVAQLPLAAGEGQRTFLLACRYFAAERFEFADTRTFRARPERFDLLVLLAGAGQIQWTGGSAPCGAGECWLVPAEMGSLDLVPRSPMTVIRAYVPDLESMRRQFRSARQSNPELPEVIFD